MTIKECIDIVDNLKPNQYSIKEKVGWLSFIDAIIINDVLKTHEGYDGRYDMFEGYSEDKLSVALIVPNPYDRLYTAYLQMKIDSENGETARYNNSAALYNAYMMEYRKYYNKTHMPLNNTDRRNSVPPTKVTAGLSDAEYENIKRDLFYQLSEHFSSYVAHDKLYGIVTSYVSNNSEMLRGKEGKEGKQGERGESAYEIAVRKGFKGTESQWLESLKSELKPARIANVALNSSDWKQEGEASLFSQVVKIEGVTPYSQVDLTPSVEQLAIFYEKDLAFVTENDDGFVTVYAIGQKPLSDYTIQVTITEVTITEVTA